MMNPTPRPGGRRTYSEARRRSQVAFEAAARGAGHGPFLRTGAVGDGGSWTQYACACHEYRSRAGSRAAARRGWVSHARAVMISLRRAA